MRFEDLMARADDDTLRELVGVQPLSILRHLGEDYDRPAILRDTLLKVRTPDSLLRDGGSRTALLMTLARSDAERLAVHLGSTGGDPFRYLRRLSIAKNSPLESALLEWFDVDRPDEPAPETPEPTRVQPGYALFKHQRDAVQRALGALRRDPNRVLLHMPTGSGKTRTAMNIIAQYIRINEPGLVVWLAYSEELCSQAADEFELAWRHLGNRQVTVHRFWGSASLDIDSCHDGIVVAGLAKMYARARADIAFLSKLSDRTGLVIIDEAHQAVAETYKFVLETLVQRRRGVQLLGLSATPGRTWNDPEQDLRLAQFFSRSKVTLSTPPLNPVDYLISEGYLAAPQFVALPYSGAPLTEAQRVEIAADLDIPASVLRRLAEDQQRNLLIVRSAEALLKRHARVLVFAATVDHARTLAIVLSARGSAASAVTSTTPRGQRQSLIERYRTPGGPPQALCNYGVLTTGFDAPSTSAALIARPTKSLVLYSQMVGRALRGPRSGGNSEAEIHTVVDLSLPGFGELGEAFLNWEDVWEESTNG
jgi:DNA repair protein RadD